MPAKKQKTSKPRVRKAEKYKSFRLSKKIKPDNPPIPGIYRLFKQSVSLFVSNKKLFLGITFFYIILSLVFVTGFGLPFDLIQTKNEITETLGENVDSFTTSFALFGFLVSQGSSAQNEAGAIYQMFLSLIFSLVIIWSIRQIYAGEKITVKQGFYQGVYPLVPFLLVLCVLGLQLIPLLVGNFLLSTVLANGLAITFAEKFVWFLLFCLLALLSLYMLISSTFALYIVTLPNMTPIQALRSARNLVLHRRLQIFLRLLGFPILSIFIFLVILLPLIYLMPAAAGAVFTIMSGLILFFFHAYMYNLYRSLL